MSSFKCHKESEEHIIPTSFPKNSKLEGGSDQSVSKFFRMSAMSPALYSGEATAELAAHGPCLQGGLHATRENRYQITKLIIFVYVNGYEGEVQCY